MVIIIKDKTKTEVIQYIHGCCFSPTSRTFLKAIKNGNFLTWPGLNNQKLFNRLPPGIAKSLRHLGQEIKNLQSAKSVKSEVEVEEDSDPPPDA